MPHKFLRLLLIWFAMAVQASGQPSPEAQKRMDEINNRPRYFWCAKDQAQYTLNLVVRIDGKEVTQIQIPLAKAKPDNMPEDDQQKIAEYHFLLKKRGNREFRGVSNGSVEGNFWIGLARNNEIELGHSWVCGHKVILHEMLQFVVGKPESYSGSGIQICATWLKN